jgi:hypothetical protein
MKPRPSGPVEIFKPAVVWRASQCGWLKLGKTRHGHDLWEKPNGERTSWAPLLGWKSATFVSLQYGDIKNDLEALRELTGGRVIHDTEINQLVDLDGFAAQIAALDGVISISNTTIDMAGMLGVPTVHIRDDNLSSAIWPRSGPSPWYPDMIFLYRERRPWSEVFAEARTRLEQVISTGR